jgi:hypothetical protein
MHDIEQGSAKQGLKLPLLGINIASKRITRDIEQGSAKQGLTLAELL